MPENTGLKTDIVGTEAKRLKANMEGVVAQKRERLDRVEDAFLHERSIDRQTYERQRDQLREQLALAEMELSEATENQLDVEGCWHSPRTS